MAPTNKISFQGDYGANSDMACRDMFPTMEPLPCPTFEDAFVALETGEVDLGMIPIENTLAGRVADIHYLLPLSRLHIVGEYFMPIRFQLMVLPGVKLDEIRTVHSHIHALGQCRKIIRSHGWKAVVAGDTAGAAKLVSEKGDRTMAALAPRLAASLYGLDILAENVEDSENNVTRFVVLSRDEDEPKRVSALQGDGRVCDERGQHDQARELPDRRQIHRDPVLCRYRGTSGGRTGEAGAGRTALLLGKGPHPRRLQGA